MNVLAGLKTTNDSDLLFSSPAFLVEKLYLFQGPGDGYNPTYKVQFYPSPKVNASLPSNLPMFANSKSAHWKVGTKVGAEFTASPICNKTYNPFMMKEQCGEDIGSSEFSYCLLIIVIFAE